MMETLLFFVFATAAVLSAILVVVFRNPVYSALSLVVTLFCLTGLFVLLDAYFVAAVQVMVYAGAIMVLFLFVIMLLNLGREEALKEQRTFPMRLGIVLALLLLLQIGYIAGAAGLSPRTGGLTVDEAARIGNPRAVGLLLYTDFLFPFEIASVILLVALIGVVVLARRARAAGR